MFTSARIHDFRRIAWSLAFVLLLSIPASSELLPIKTYTTADGLAHNTVNRIVRDSRGFLWFCTEEGLARFDGYTFTNYGTNEGMPHATVNDLLETREGDYWVATGAGLVRFNPRGKPTNRIIYENEANAGTTPLFTIVVPKDTDRYARTV